MKFLLALLLAVPLHASNVRYLITTDPAWTIDVWAINRSDAPQALNVANCGAPNTVSVPAHGFKLLRDLTRDLDTRAFLCVPNGYIYVDGGDNSLDVFSIARNVNGMRLYVPGVRVTLGAYGTGVPLDVLNFGEDVARVYLYQNGTRGGPVTFIIRDGKNNEIAREKCDVVPGRIVSCPIAVKIPDGGSVLVTPGWRLIGQGAPGVNDPRLAPDGETYVFGASGVEIGASAPYVSVPKTTEPVP